MKRDEYNSKGQEYAPLPDEYRGGTKASEYSRRPGEAAPPPGSVPPEEKDVRKKRLQKVQLIMRLTAASIMSVGIIMTARPAEHKPEPTPVPTAEPTAVVTLAPTPAPAPAETPAAPAPAPVAPTPAPAPEPQKLFCRFCGRQIPTDAIFCNYCGKDIR